MFYLFSFKFIHVIVIHAYIYKYEKPVYCSLHDEVLKQGKTTAIHRDVCGSPDASGKLPERSLVDTNCVSTFAAFMPVTVKDSSEPD